jgi:hypothetical protein
VGADSERLNSFQISGVDQNMRRLTRKERIRCRAIWTDGRTRIVCTTMDTVNYRWVGKNQNLDSGKLVGFPSSITGSTVYCRTLPVGPGSRSLSFKLTTFLRRFQPTGRHYWGEW